jgi:hypothetical protein
VWYRRLHTVSLGLVLLTLAACSRPPEEESNLRRIIADQVSRYPRMQIQDLYKFLHQAALGSEHAVRDTAMARNWLRREIASLDTAAAFEPQVDPLSPDGKLVRVHLRPYLRNGGDPEPLLRAFIRTANEAQGDTSMLEHYWSIAEAMCLEGRLPFPRGDMETFFTARRGQGFPAIHHSEVYGQLYRPAYRVILRELLQPDHEVRE